MNSGVGVDLFYRILFGFLFVLGLLRRLVLFIRKERAKKRLKQLQEEIEQIADDITHGRPVSEHHTKFSSLLKRGLPYCPICQSYVCRVSDVAGCLAVREGKRMALLEFRKDQESDKK